MFRSLLSLDRFRRIAAVAAGRERALRNWYLEAGYTQEETRGINLLKQWLSPEQLAQYESHRYFDVIGRQSGKHYRILYGTAMNIREMDPRVEGQQSAGVLFPAGR